MLAARLGAVWWARAEIRAMVVFGHDPRLCAGFTLPEHRARAGGPELAAACHVRAADPTASFALPEGTCGIYVGGGASTHVARLLGAARMADMMLTGRVLDAETTECTGLVQHLAAGGEARTTAGALAERIAGMTPLPVLAVLQAPPRIQDVSEDDGLFVESLMATLVQVTPDARARLTEFLEGRNGKVARQTRDEQL